ncbi:hypothetical protein GCK72_016006 [Caenorhabditis remanei]|uniref:Uncharacterized protein n=1 Tax=Caenorhabditis remanei TaxID=31234 RepID=A0A6A5GXZ3_CAERE|nr:hypothetical protein GCK72_016006 [Caenorhabditis remanei]KAF1759539.1 hypothetical protein GCK72_016006 [Caenorhabditis remanei]
MEKLSESCTAFEKFKDALKQGGDKKTKEIQQYTKTYSAHDDLEVQLKSAISRLQLAEHYKKSQEITHKIKEDGFRETIAERDQTIEYLMNQLAQKGCKTCKSSEKSEKKLSFFAGSKSTEAQIQSAKTDNYIKSLESEVQNLKKSVKENEEYYENSVSNYAKQIHETVKYMHELRLDYEAKDHMLWKTLEEQKKKIEAMETEHQKALNVIGKQELQLEDLRKIRDAVEDADAEKLQNSQKDSEYLSFDVALLTRQLEEARQDNRTAQKEIIELSAKLLNKENDLETAQKKIDELSDKLLVKEADVDDFQQEIENLLEDIQEHKAQEEFLNESIQRMEAEHAEAMQELQVIIDKQDDDLEKYRMEEEKEANAVERYFAGLKIDEEGELEEEGERRESVDSDGWKKLDESDGSDVEEEVEAN